MKSSEWEKIKQNKRKKRKENIDVNYGSSGSHKNVTRKEIDNHDLQLASIWYLLQLFYLIF